MHPSLPAACSEKNCMAASLTKLDRHRRPPVKLRHLRAQAGVIDSTGAWQAAFQGLYACCSYRYDYVSLPTGLFLHSLFDSSFNSSLIQVQWLMLWDLSGATRPSHSVFLSVGDVCSFDSSTHGQGSSKTVHATSSHRAGLPPVTPQRGHAPHLDRQSSCIAEPPMRDELRSSACTSHTGAPPSGFEYRTHLMRSDHIDRGGS